MDKKTLRFTNSDKDLKFAAKLLKQGKTVIFPTETVYGLGADARKSETAEKIFAAKGRPSDNPLIVHIADVSMLDKLVEEIPDFAKALMDKFWPGPLTLIFKKSDIVPKTVTGGLDTVAIRIPAHKTARRLLEIAQIPIAAPSANLSGKPSPTTIQHVIDDMDGRVDGIICDEDCSVGVESAVLDISGDTPRLFRPGGVTQEEIEETIGVKVLVNTEMKEGDSPKSPGLKYKHYSPDAEVVVLSGSSEKKREYATELSREKVVGALIFEEENIYAEEIITYSLGSKKEPLAVAHNLFAAMRELDKKGVEIILAPEIPDDGIWMAVRNRLYRAAGEKIIKLESDIKKIIFVCTGNTCRSPMAEGILDNIAGEEVIVISAGIFASGEKASANSVAVMKEIGIDISNHISKQLTVSVIEESDIVITMTKAHKNMLISIAEDMQNKIVTLGEWAGEDKDVADPFGGDIETYRECREQIFEMVKKGWENNR